MNLTRCHARSLSSYAGVIKNIFPTFELKLLQSRYQLKKENLPPLNFHNLQEIKAVEHDYSVQSIDGVSSVFEQYASSNCLHSLADIRNKTEK